jgi:hypothetical protein
VAAIHGKNSYLLWNSVNLSPFLTDVTFGGSADTAEVSAFGDTNKEYVVGLVDRNISVSGNYDAVASGPDATLGAAVGTSATLEYGPGGNTAGLVKYSGSDFLTSYEVSGGIGDAVTFTAEFVPAGATTRGTFS